VPTEIIVGLRSLETIKPGAVVLLPLWSVNEFNCLATPGQFSLYSQDMNTRRKIFSFKLRQDYYSATTLMR
jgi:hypothetical protein